jgi:hypothetical protein
VKKICRSSRQKNARTNCTAASCFIDLGWLASTEPIVQGEHRHPKKCWQTQVAAQLDTEAADPIWNSWRGKRQPKNGKWPLSRSLWFGCAPGGRALFVVGGSALRGGAPLRALGALNRCPTPTHLALRSSKNRR